MIHYRLYRLTDGHISRAHDLEAADDSRALEMARLKMEDHDFELWQGTRKIVSIESHARA